MSVVEQVLQQMVQRVHRGLPRWQRAQEVDNEADGIGGGRSAGGVAHGSGVGAASLKPPEVAGLSRKAS